MMKTTLTGVMFALVLGFTPGTAQAYSSWEDGSQNSGGWFGVGKAHPHDLNPDDREGPPWNPDEEPQEASWSHPSSYYGAPEGCPRCGDG